MNALTARDLMRTDFLTLRGDARMDATIDLLLQESRSGKRPNIAVAIADGRFEGFVSLMSALGALMAGKPDAPVREFLLRETPVLSPDDNLYKALSGVVASKADAVPVMNGPELLGVVFLTDVFDHIVEEALTDITFNPED